MPSVCSVQGGTGRRVQTVGSLSLSLSADSLPYHLSLSPGSAAMVSAAVGVLCVVVLLPAVLASSCPSFWDKRGQYHQAQRCSYSEFCCGHCQSMGCCADPSYRLSKEAMAMCPNADGGSSNNNNYNNNNNNNKRSKLGTLLGSVLGSILPILLCVGLVICCVAPCCLFYKKCRKGGNRDKRNNPIVMNPRQPNNPGGYQPAFNPGGYQPPSNPGGYQPPFPGYEPPSGGHGPGPRSGNLPFPGYEPPSGGHGPGQPSGNLPFPGYEPPSYMGGGGHSVFATPPAAGDHSQPPYNPDFDLSSK